MGSAVHDFVATARDFSDTKREQLKSLISNSVEKNVMQGMA